ncbi:MAG TPA: C40 family peptidase [Fimbriimonadaceae bacterium]|nr:C40 family peptidase [Fimbriimonadaceae bacterium]
MMLRRITAALLACALSVGAFAEKVVLGKLGQVTETTRIYSRPSANSQVYYKVKAYEYVVIKPSSQTWCKVLLQNGSYGYVKTAMVAKLPYEVTANRPVRNTYRTMSTEGYRGTNNSVGAAMAAQYATHFIGTPYVWGGTDENRGIDCSGLVQKMFGEVAHIKLPRTAAEQVHVGTPVTRLQDLRAGDRLYFWDAKRGIIGHTGIYLGNGYFVHSSRTHNGVGTDFLGEKKWLNILVAARRS